MSIGAHASFMRNLKRQISLQITTLSVLAGSFTILVIATLFQQNVERLLTQWGDEVKVNVYLKEGTSRDDERKINDHLSKVNVFEKIHFLTKKDAAEKFKQRIGEYAPGLLSDLEFDNPLPSSYEMVVKGGLKSSLQFDKMMSVVKEIKTMSGVDEVSYGQGWVENYATVLRAFSVVSHVFMGVLLLGSLFVIGNSIGNSIAQRRDEIEILELFGATRKMILWPFIYEGVLMGFVAAATALLITYFLYLSQAEVLVNELTFWNLKAKIEFLSLSRLVMILCLGAGLGAMGSYLWARKMNTGWAAAESAKRS